MKKKKVLKKNRTGPKPSPKSEKVSSTNRCKTKWICDTDEEYTPIEEAFKILDEGDKAFKKELDEFLSQFCEKECDHDS